MLFNSYIYILIFLPIVLLVYFYLNKQKLLVASKAWLVASSLFFYSYWNPKYLILIILSIVFNFAIGSVFSKKILGKKSSKTVLFIGISFNLLLLGYYKYYNFFVENIDSYLGLNLQIKTIVLPLAISFFTFQQIAYLVDSYKGETKEYDFLNYILFVSFFPQLIAGPIVHHKEMMPQFANLKNKIFSPHNFSKGLFILAMGLFKKVVIADTLALWANNGYNNHMEMSFFNAWIVTLAYTFQLYFDFSGYTDMAIGSALMFNIKLPINFNSPYKSLSLQDFWRRWHMTLSRWLKDYIYIPLGGNRKGEFRAILNLIITFFLGGLWHGAGWTFVFWGLLHGTGLAVFKLWKKLNINFPKFVAIAITFLFVHIGWVFFRSENFDQAKYILSGLIGLNGINLPLSWQTSLAFLKNTGIHFTDCYEFYGTFWETTVLFALVSYIVFKKPNSMEIAKKFDTTYGYLILTAFLFAISFFGMNTISEFLYFNF